MTREEFLALPLERFIRGAIKLNASPPEDGTWRSPLWEFTRYMKARREFARCDGFAAAVIVEVVLARHTPDNREPWDHHFGALPGIDDPRSEFIDTWDKVTTPASMDALTVACRAAQEFPLRPKRAYSGGYCELISIAGHLQSARCTEPIYLPVERLAEILRCDRKSVGRYIKFGLKEGLLRKVSECIPHQRAAEFTFRTDRFDWESGVQIK